jgi:hypothetical protein
MVSFPDSLIFVSPRIISFNRLFVAYTQFIQPPKPYFGLFRKSDISVFRLQFWKDAHNSRGARVFDVF